MGHPEADSGRGASHERPPPPPPPPPPYTADYTPPPAQPQPQQQRHAAVVRRHFPPAFSMYKASSSSPWGERDYVIGEHQAQPPLYAVSLHSGWSGQPDVVLHGGPGGAAPVLAAVSGAAFGASATVALPPLPGGNSGSYGVGNGNDVGNGGTQITLAPSGSGSGSGLGPVAMAFTVETGEGPGPLRREAFEWRHSHAPEVVALGGRSAGWKLVRLATPATLTSGAEAGAAAAAAAAAGPARSRTDGREVVAVWAWPSMSASKTLKFRFLGSGATGELGERWAVAAVATALRIWDRERKARNSRRKAVAAAAAV